MKKKILLLGLTVLLIFSMAACSNQEETEPSSEPVVSQDNSEEATEPETEEPASESQEPVDVSGMEVAGEKMYYTIPEGWEKQESTEGTGLYQYTSGSSLASASIGYQEETLYSADDMIQAYEASIEQNIGAWDSMTEETVGDYSWRHYSFQDGTIQDGIYAEVYLSTTGDQTLYFEFAATSDVDLNQYIPGVLESIVIQ